MISYYFKKSTKLFKDKCYNVANNFEYEETNEERERERERELDQFYTNPIISDKLVHLISEIMPTKFSSWQFLEPSAGTGNFLLSLEKLGVSSSSIIAYDIDPKDERIIKSDYLKENIPFYSERIVIGNPPFGKRGKLALDFLNKGLSESNIVCFILPNIFNRYSMQKQIDKDAKLIISQTLEENSFIVNDKEYAVNCVFQIWTKEKFYINDLRINSPLPIRHEDFETFIHNNTKETLKYFDKEKYKWDFAVCRQGYYDYSNKISDPKKLIKNRQYFFVKAKNKKILNTIKKINFEKLSKTNTQVRGFSTTDFVAEYIKIKNKEKE